jgi:hypothetical protein
MLSLNISNAEEPANPPAKKIIPFPPVANDKIERYTAHRTAGEIVVDGKLDETSWLLAPKSPRFTDLVSGKKAIHSTQAAVMWDESFLYVGYWVEDPFVHAKFTVRDRPIYQDNDVEFFLAFDNAYYEFEINAHNTIYEGLFVWEDAYEKSGFSNIPEIDIKREGVRNRTFNGVGLNNHPRGIRRAFLNWDFPEAKTAVTVDGTLNKDDDRDRGWTVELAFPWSGMKTIALGDKRAIPPKDGNVWRMDFSRFNQYKESPPAQDSGGWAWSSHGVWDSHVPEVFPYIQFSEKKIGSK